MRRRTTNLMRSSTVIRAQCGAGRPLKLASNDPLRRRAKYNWSTYYELNRPKMVDGLKGWAGGISGISMLVRYDERLAGSQAGLQRSSRQARLPPTTAHAPTHLHYRNKLATLNSSSSSVTKSNAALSHHQLITTRLSSTPAPCFQTLTNQSGNVLL